MLSLSFTLIFFIALVIAITIHEFSHAAVADYLGDPTPRSMGRLSLNPLRHLDPLGTLMLLLVRFGWGKPVPIDPYNLRYPRRDEFLIALAGPASNLILAFLISLFLRFLPVHPTASLLLTILIRINIILAVFNLLPLPPLDGSKILLNLLPLETSLRWEQALNQYGPILLLAAIFLPFGNSNLVSLVMTPLITLLENLLL